jgi:maltose O-acetyltransferase
MLKATVRRIRDRLTGELDVADYRRKGMVIGADVHIGPGCRLDPAAAWMITVGDDVVIAPGVIVLAHDASLRRRIGYTRFAPVTIGSHVFIGAGTLILPGVTIGDDVVIGAGSLVTADIPADSLAYGRPARAVRRLSEYEAEQRARLETDGRIRFNETTPGRTYTAAERDDMRRLVPAGEYGWDA